MHDTNNSWQSEIFKKMLNYEREHCREKFVYEAMQYLKFYEEILLNKNYTYFKDHRGDFLLIAMIFSFISITHNKDSLDTDFEDYSLYQGCKNSTINSIILPEAFIDTGSTFQIPSSTFTAFYVDYMKSIANLSDWDFEYNHEIISISDGTITSLKKGTTIVKLTNKVTGTIKKIKINSGESQYSHIQQFFFTQLRNIIAHGKYKIYNSGRYDTIQEYGSYNVSKFDERYKKEFWREIKLEDTNQLNLAYGGNNFFNVNYLISCAEQVFKIDNNQFYEYVKSFYETNGDIDLLLKYKTQNEMPHFKELILLSKFYISFIYNYDTKDKDNFDYTLLNIKNISQSNNENYIYQIRTSIMHGRYIYDGNKITFWNNDKNNSNITSFQFDISYTDLEDLIQQKQMIDIENMDYDPYITFELEESKKK